MTQETTNALPTVAINGVEHVPALAFPDPPDAPHLPWEWRRMTEENLPALLAALTPEQLKRVLDAQLDIRHPKCTECGGAGAKVEGKLDDGTGNGWCSVTTCGTCGGSGRPTAPFRVAL